MHPASLTSHCLRQALEQCTASLTAGVPSCLLPQSKVCLSARQSCNVGPLAGKAEH